MSGIVDPPKIIVQTLEINRYTYDLINLIPHTSAQYRIFCYNGDVEIKYVTGLLEGEQYKEWTDDDWLDRFIKEKVDALPDVEIKPQPVQPDIPVEDIPIIEPIVKQDTTVSPVETPVIPVETSVIPVETPVETPVTPIETPVETPVSPVETTETPIEPV